MSYDGDIRAVVEPTKDGRWQWTLKKFTKDFGIATWYILRNTSTGESYWGFSDTKEQAFEDAELSVKEYYKELTKIKNFQKHVQEKTETKMFYRKDYVDE